jgi:hypothetical protein
MAEPMKRITQWHMLVVSSRHDLFRRKIYR